MDSAEKIYPTAEELSKINQMPSCPECSMLFRSQSQLNLHLAKTHKKSHLLQPCSANKIYHCPIETCSYNSAAFFTKMKLLKQHYLKVHSERNHVCTSCKKKFPTLAACNRHSDYCTVIFKCCDCDVTYPCYETLKTHGRRKKHNILEKIAYKTSSNRFSCLKVHKSEESVVSSKLRLLLPKPSNSTGAIIITDTSDEGCQTENMNKFSRETQTLLACRMPNSNLTVETQTIGDYCTRKNDYLSSKTAKTQTSITDPKTTACNTSLSLDDFEMNIMKEVERSSSSTQTTLPKNSSSTHDSIHTNTPDLLTEALDTSFFNCNTETQTDFIFNDDLFKYCDDYSNMCTQTCEDLLLGEIELNDIHTQTVFDDVLKSVESQTVMSQSRVVTLGCKDNVTHMETQTDYNFQQLLEEINA